MNPCLSFFFVALVASSLLALLAPHSVTAAVSRFAVLGDYGRATSPGEKLVADMIGSWNPDAIFTLGDNSYGCDGCWDLLDTNIGQFYGKYIFPLADSNVSTGAADKINKFNPAVGNHDGRAIATFSGEVVHAYPYLRYFRGVAPNMSAGNGGLMLRYYDVRKGPVHFFMLNSNSWEPDGITADSVQAMWLKEKLAQSTAPHRVVCWHHLLFSNEVWERQDPQLRWPFKDWGVSVVMSGHAHVFERFDIPGFPPIVVNGVGGTTPLYPLRPSGELQPGTVVWFNATWGAQLVEADNIWMNLTFKSVDGKFTDVLAIPAVNPQMTTTVLPTTTAVPPTSPPPTSTASSGLATSVPANNAGSGDDSTSSHSNEAGKGMGVGILIGIIIAMCVFGIGWVIVWYRRQRSERAREALGEDDNFLGRNRQFSITPVSAYEAPPVGHELDNRD